MRCLESRKASSPFERRILAMSRSRRRRSPSPAKPHHAGVAYRMDATVVALATRWSSCCWRPWVRRSLNANIEEEQVFNTCGTWSVMVNLALRWTPKTLSACGNSIRPFNEWLRRWMHGPGSNSSHNQLFRLRRVDFHVISFSPFLDVIVFIRDRSYAPRTHQQIGVVGKLCNLVLPVLRMEV